MPSSGRQRLARRAGFERYRWAAPHCRAGAFAARAERGSAAAESLLSRGHQAGPNHHRPVLNIDTFTVQILDSSEHLVSLHRSDLRESGFIENSPMPSYRGKLTSDELADVVAYLGSLKGL